MSSSSLARVDEPWGRDPRARFVTMANGPLNRPKLPGDPRHRRPSRGTPSIPADGITNTRGVRAGRWARQAWPTRSVADHRHRRDRRSNAFPTWASRPQQLYVFQRTPSSVDVRGNKHRRTRSGRRTSSRVGIEHRMENFNGLVSGVPQPESTSSTTAGLTSFGKMMLFLVQGEDQPEICRPTPLSEKSWRVADFEKMNQIRARAEDSLVNDPEHGREH